MKAVILTEGGKNIGFGHIVRCFALYQALLKEGVAVEIIIKGDYSVENILQGTTYRIFDWLEKKEQIFPVVQDADIVLVDSYLADFNFYKNISNIARIPVFLDDYKRLAYPRGIIVNGAINAKKLNYPLRDGNTYLLGNKYMPLRKEFWRVPQKKINKKVHSVMVAFGGCDVKNMTPKVLRLLIRKHPGLTKIMIIGEGFKNIANIEASRDNKTKMLCYPSAEIIKKTMIDADIAISACGQTLNELARIGVPTIAVAVAQNQLNNVESWEDSGFIEYAGYWKDDSLLSNLAKSLNYFSSYATRVKRNKIGSRLVDGKGAERITNRFLKWL